MNMKNHVRPVAILTTALALAGSVMLTGCESDAQTGALIGTGIGAGAGAIIGHQSGHGGEGALIGGAAGALGGYLIGNESDKEEHDQRYHDYDY